MKTFARILMVLAGLLTASLFFLPMWRIDLVAPQYPDGLGMYIHIDHLEGVKPGDLKNIDILNHYVGMKPLPKPEDMWEFTVFPIVVGVMTVLAIVFALIGRPALYLTWFVIMSVLGILGLYDFYQWLYEYGTNLDPEAPIKLVDEFGNPMQYVPPLIGYKQLLNFEVYSYPAIGGVLLGIGILLSLIAFWLAYKTQVKHKIQLA